MENNTIDKLLTTFERIILNEHMDHFTTEKMLNNMLNIIERIINNEEELNRVAGKCVICFKNKSTHVFIPCGHFCFCNECVSILSTMERVRCPICRENGNYYKTYSSTFKNT